MTAPRGPACCATCGMSPGHQWHREGVDGMSHPFATVPASVDNRLTDAATAETCGRCECYSGTLDPMGFCGCSCHPLTPKRAAYLASERCARCGLFPNHYFHAEPHSESAAGHAFTPGPTRKAYLQVPRNMRTGRTLRQMHGCDGWMGRK